MNDKLRSILLYENSLGLTSWYLSDFGGGLIGIGVGASEGGSYSQSEES